MGTTVLAAAGSGLLDGVDLSSLTTSITADTQTLIPIGIAIMGIMIGCSLIPKVVYKFF